MDRKQIIRKNLNLDGVGLEIGPWCSPVCPKSEGYHIEILDYASREDLRRELRQVNAQGQSLHAEESIEEVDYVWSGEKYAALTGKKNYYDYIIASHVIEHMVDLISFFHDCSDIIKNDGILSLAIPDKRYEFDLFRECTSIKTVIDTHERAEYRHSLGTIIDSTFNQANLKNSALIPYYAGLLGKDAFEPLKEAETVCNIMNAYNSNKEYKSCHSWVFTPASFQILIYELYFTNYIDFMISSITAVPERMEFYVQLKKAEKNIEFNQDTLLDLHLSRQKEDLIYYEKVSNLYKQIENAKRDQKNIYVYGAGEYAGNITELLIRCALPVKGYIVSDQKRQTDVFYGAPVYELSELQLDNYRDKIFLGVSDLYQNEVIHNLEERGFKEYII